MIAQAEESNELLLSETESQKSLPTESQKIGMVAYSCLPYTSHDLKRKLPEGHLYASTSRYNLKTPRNGNLKLKSCFTESENGSETKSESCENASLDQSLQNKVTTPKELIQSNITPPRRSRCDVSSDITLIEPSSSLLSKAAFKSLLSTPGYLTYQYGPNKNVLATPLSPQTNLCATPTALSLKSPFSCPERINSSIPGSSPRMRLSQSLNGKAELVTEKSPTPKIQIACPRTSSGNKSSFEKKGKLQRSKSAPGSCTHQTGIGCSNASLRSRRANGRSRDARSWTYFCDGKSRDDFFRQIENASLGSAVAAISLIRSADSPSKILNHKCEILPTKDYRSSLQATDKSELQHITSSSFKLSAYNHDCVKDCMLTSPCEDSDKENWLPLQNGSPCRRLLPSSRQNKLLMPTNMTFNNHNTDLGIMKGRKRKLNDSFVNVSRDRPQLEIVRRVGFFGNGDKNNGKTGDIGAIQGLLSLRLGNWR